MTKKKTIPIQFVVDKKVSFNRYSSLISELDPPCGDCQIHATIRSHLFDVA